MKIDKTRMDALKVIKALPAAFEVDLANLTTTRIQTNF